MRRYLQVFVTEAKLNYCFNCIRKRYDLSENYVVNFTLATLNVNIWRYLLLSIQRVWKKYLLNNYNIILLKYVVD